MTLDATPLLDIALAVMFLVEGFWLFDDALHWCLRWKHPMMMMLCTGD